MQRFPLLEQDNVSQQNRTWGGARRGSRREHDFDTLSVQTNEGAWSRYGQGGSANVSTSFFDCIRNLQVHVETMLNRFHDLYERKGRAPEATRLSEESIKSLLSQYDGDRVAAALHLLAETYKRCELPQATEAQESLMDWWEYLRHHRHPNRTPNRGEIEYEERKADKAKAAALELWKNYNMLLEDRDRWLDTYIAEAAARETEAHMNLRIQALNAADKEFALGTNLRHHNVWFDNRPSIPTHRRRVLISNSRVPKDKLDFDKMGHFEARKAEKDRIMTIFHQYRPETQVMGRTSKDHQRTKAIIDTGDEGPNVVSRRFLSGLKLESIIETDWSRDSEMVTDVNGREFQPMGWVELYFKFEKLPGGWHSSLFWVADVQNYDIIIGMPCLLQDNIKSKVIAPLVPNQSQKNKGKDNHQVPNSRDSQDRRDRAEKRRNGVRKDDPMNWKSGGSSNGGGGTPTIAFLGTGRRDTSTLQATVDDVLEEEEEDPDQLPPPTRLSTNHSHSSNNKESPSVPTAAPPPLASFDLSRHDSKISQTDWADGITGSETEESLHRKQEGKRGNFKTPAENPSNNADPAASSNGRPSPSGQSAHSRALPVYFPPEPSGVPEPWHTVTRRKKGRNSGGGGVGPLMWRSSADGRGG